MESLVATPDKIPIFADEPTAAACPTAPVPVTNGVGEVGGTGVASDGVCMLLSKPPGCCIEVGVEVPGPIDEA